MPYLKVAVPPPAGGPAESAQAPGLCKRAPDWGSQLRIISDKTATLTSPMRIIQPRDRPLLSL